MKMGMELGDREVRIFEKFGEKGSVGEGKEIRGDFGGALPEEGAGLCG